MLKWLSSKMLMVKLAKRDGEMSVSECKSFVPAGFHPYSKFSTVGVWEGASANPFSSGSIEATWMGGCFIAFLFVMAVCQKEDKL